MKLISKQILFEHGFNVVSDELSPNLIMTKGTFKVVLNANGTCTYRNTGIDYPLKDLASLKKLYKEVNRENLLISTT